MEDSGDTYKFDHGTIVRIAESVRFTENFNRNPRLYNMIFAFELLTDASSGEAFAKILTQDEVIVIQNPALLKYKWGVLDGAKPGYKGDCTAFANHFYFVQGPCVQRCISSGSIATGTPPTGSVGESFTHTVTPTGITSGSLSIQGLPPGLTANSSGAISGTPTEAGEFFVVVQATGPKTGPGTVSSGAVCTISKAFVIKIEGGEEEPSPEPTVGGS